MIDAAAAVALWLTLLGSLPGPRSARAGAAIATERVPLAGGELLAEKPGVWQFNNFLSTAQVERLLNKLPTESSAWTNCEGNAHGGSRGVKQCSAIPVGRDPLILAVLDQLSATWSVNMTRITSLPVVRYPPGTGATEPHVDTYVSDNTVFDVSNVICACASRAARRREHLL